MTKLDIFPKIETTHFDLMVSAAASDLKLRIMNTVSGSSVLCIIIEETSDSFLVALPSKLLALQDKRVVQPYMDVRFIRMMKAPILTVVPCFGEFELFYIRYLLDQGKQQYPEVINDEYEKRLKVRLEKLIAEAEEMKAELQSLSKSDSASGSVEEQRIMPLPDSKYKH